MGDGYWSETAAVGGEWYGVPGKGAWFRKGEGQPFFMTGGAHEEWNRRGAEGGELGFPTSNFDEARGMQTFERGAIWWNGQEFVSGPSAMGSRPFDIGPTPPPPPA